MWLFLDTHINGTYRFGWLDGDRIDVQEYSGRTQTLLEHLHERWTPETMPIEGVCVVSGPGTFSAIRTGVLYANLVSQIQRVPLVGVSVQESQDMQELSHKLKQGSLPTVAAVTPVYDAAPNITTPHALST